MFDTHKSVGTEALCSKKQWPVCPWGLGSDRWVGWDGGPTQILDQHLIIGNHFLPLPFSWSWDLRLPLSPHQPSCKSQGLVYTIREAHPAIPHSRHQSGYKINSPLQTALGLRKKKKQSIHVFSKPIEEPSRLTAFLRFNLQASILIWTVPCVKSIFCLPRQKLMFILTQY